MGEPEDIRDAEGDARAGRVRHDGAAADSDAGVGIVAAAADYDDPRWRRVYAAVIVFAAVVITALWAFSRAFSS